MSVVAVVVFVVVRCVGRFVEVHVVLAPAVDEHWDILEQNIRVEASSIEAVALVADKFAFTLTALWRHFSKWVGNPLTTSALRVLWSVLTQASPAAFASAVKTWLCLAAAVVVLRFPIIDRF